MDISLDSIDSDNTATISFNKEMVIFNVTTDDYSVKMTGPANTYQLNYTASFENNKHLKVYVT